MQNILGQDRALELIRKAIAAGRVHHAWIFSGPKGVGKFTAAIEVARILLDPLAAPNLASEIEADPEGETSEQIDARTHPDLHIVRKELVAFSENAELRRKKLSNIPIDLLRERIIGGKTGDDRYHDGPAYRTALRNHGKVFIIDEAELIMGEGQNALLKTLEEPPPQTFFFLITSRPEWLLPTIRSRCQHVRFGLLDAKSMNEWLNQSGLELNAKERAWILSFSAGSPGIAQLAVEYGFTIWQRTLDPMLAELDRGMYPAGMGEALAAFADDFAVAWVKANRNASKDAANKDGARHVLSLLAAHARRQLISSNGDRSSAIRAIELIRSAERHLERNVNMKQALENLVVQWSRIRAEPVAGAR